MNNLKRRGILLTSLVVEYHQTQQQIKDLEERKKALKAEIDLALSAMGDNRYEDSQYSAVMSESQRIKYDQGALMDLVLSKGIDVASVEKVSIDLTKLETLVANGKIDPIEIAQCAKVSTVKTLTVKKSEG